jgi:hypothetical protein
MVVVIVIVIIIIFVVIVMCKYIMVELQSVIDCLCFFSFLSLLTTKVYHCPLFAWVWQQCLMSDPRTGVADPNAGLVDPTKLGLDMIVRPKYLECDMVCQSHDV